MRHLSCMLRSVLKETILLGRFLSRQSIFFLLGLWANPGKGRNMILYISFMRLNALAIPFS